MLLRGPNQTLRLDLCNVLFLFFPTFLFHISQWKHGWFWFGFTGEQGQPPTPRSHHASAILGSNGYISGGVVSVFTWLSKAKQAVDRLLFACTSAGCGSAGFVLRGPGELDLEPNVTLFHRLITVINVSVFDLVTLITCLLYASDLPCSSSPPGRSMFSMTPTSDHTLFIFGGAGADRNTLSKSAVFLWFFYVSVWPFDRCGYFCGSFWWFGVSHWVWLRPLPMRSLVQKTSSKQSRFGNPFKLCLMLSGG